MSGHAFRHFLSVWSKEGPKRCGIQWGFSWTLKIYEIFRNIPGIRRFYANFKKLNLYIFFYKISSMQRFSRSLNPNMMVSVWSETLFYQKPRKYRIYCEIKISLNYLFFYQVMGFWCRWIQFHAFRLIRIFIFPETAEIPNFTWKLKFPNICFFLNQL